MLPYVKFLFLTIMINWEEEVKEYRENHDTDEYIHEWVDSLVPIYYGDIISQFNDMNLVVGPNAVGLPIWKVMAFRIWEVYHEEFCDAYYS